MDFGEAIKLLKQGKKVQREGWNGKNQYIELATNISYINANKETINAEHEAIGNKADAIHNHIIVDINEPQHQNNGDMWFKEVD